MKKINIKRSVELASLAVSSLGLSLIGFASSVHAAGTTYYWAGYDSPITDHGATPVTSADVNISNPVNWSSSNSSYAPASTGFENGATLIFNATGTTSSAPLVTSGVLNLPNTIEVSAGYVHLVDTASSAINMAPGGKIKADNPLTTGLVIDYANDTGALTLDGFVTSGVGTYYGPMLKNAGNSGVNGPLNLLYSSGTTVLSMNNPYYISTDVTAILGTAGVVNVGAYVELDLMSSTLGGNYSVSASTNGTIFLQGQTVNSGNPNGKLYSEAYTLNGGLIMVNGGTAQVSSLTLNGNSYVEVSLPTDALKAQTFTANGFTLSHYVVSDQGSFPTSSTGTGSGSGSGSGSSTSTTTAKTPDTGFAQLVNHPMIALVVTVAGSMGLLVAARYTKKNGFKLSR